MPCNASSPSSVRTGTIAGAIGNVLEWYDFSVYAFFAPVFAVLFFPSKDPVVSLINVFGIFAVGYFLRPVGGIILGQVGDRYGRRKALILSVLLMAIPSALVGCLPTYGSIGVAAPVLLTLLRVFQGLSVGGEMIGSMSYLVEIAPPKRRGYYGSWSLFGAVAGILLGSAVAALMHHAFPQEAITAWGWRIPFLAGISIGIVGIWMRCRLTESPEFVREQARGLIGKWPVVEAMKTVPLKILQVAMMNMIMGTAFYTLFVWMPTYLVKLLPAPVPHALWLNTLAMGALIGIMPLAGWLSDVFGRRFIMLICVVGLIVTVYPLFGILAKGSTLALMGVFLVFALWVGGLYGTMPAAMAGLFPARIRFSATGLGYNMAFAIFSGTAPMVSTWLIHRTGDLASPAIYLVVLGIISLPAYILLRPAAGSALEDEGTGLIAG